MGSHMGVGIRGSRSLQPIALISKLQTTKNFFFGEGEKQKTYMQGLQIGPVH